MAFKLGYVGSKGTSLVRLRDANQPDVNGNRPNSRNYGFMDEFATISSSTYHACRLRCAPGTWHGLSGFTGYTLSKSLDDASDGIDFNFRTVALPQNSNNLPAEHGPSNFDTRQRFTAAFTYQIPGWHGPGRLARRMATQYHFHRAERTSGAHRQLRTIPAADASTSFPARPTSISGPISCRV